MTSRPWIYVVSDATGSTAENVVRATLLQFGHQVARLRMWPGLRTRHGINDMLDAAREVDALVVFTLVNGELRDHVHRRAERLDVEVVDLIGAFLGKLAMFLDREPIGRPGLLHRVDDDYFRRIEAMEFTTQHDDGQRLRTLDRADVVLVGVSRTSKTPVCAYLASRGLKAANVPLVESVPPPEELLDLDPQRVFALTISPQALITIRRNRMSRIGGARDGHYAERDHVRREIRWANAFCRRHDWTLIDVTNRAVEETAATILKHYTRPDGARDAE